MQRSVPRTALTSYTHIYPSGVDVESSSTTGTLRWIVVSLFLLQLLSQERDVISQDLARALGGKAARYILYDWPNPSKMLTLF